MWPFKKKIKEVIYTETELNQIVKIVRKDLIEEAVQRSLEVGTLKEAVKRIKRLKYKYDC